MQSITTTDTPPQSSLVPMAIIGGLFFIFGFITWLNGALIPFLQIVCQLGETQALFIAFSFYIAYVVMALPMAKVLEHTGYKMGMVFGLILVAIGALLFIPAAHSQQFALFLAAQFVVGSGLTILQTASNPYIVKIGPQESAAARISIMGLLNKGAGVVAPLVFTALVLGDFSHINAVTMAALSAAEQQAQIELLAQGLITPYLGMALSLLVLALLLKFSSLPELDLEDQQTTDQQQGSVFAFPQLILGVISLFLYVGVEVIAGDTIGLFASNLGVQNVTTLTSYTMSFMVLGYLLGLLLIPRLISQSQALTASALLGLLLTLAILTADPSSTALSQMLWGWSQLPLFPDPVVYVAILGLANALVWPAIWPLALDGLGKMLTQGSALLIMGIAGGAILPLIYGTLSEIWHGQQAYIILFPCYLFILFYAIKGHKLRHWG